MTWLTWLHTNVRVLIDSEYMLDAADGADPKHSLNDVYDDISCNNANQISSSVLVAQSYLGLII